MTTAQVIETSVTVNNNSPIQDYVHPDDQTQPFLVLSVIYKTFHKNFTVNMYYVNRKIKKKNTIGLAQRIVIFLHCPFPVKVSGTEG